MTPAVKTGAGRSLVVGLVTTIALLGGSLTWAALTQISGAVIGSGSVEVVGRPRPVQHLDGGVVDAVLVAEGQTVADGQVLIRLDSTLLSANLNIYRTRLSEAMAQRDRLIAEQLGSPDIAFAPADQLIADVDPSLHQAAQRAVFSARRDLEAGRREQLAEKIAQYRNQTVGVEGLIAAKNEQLRLIEQELATVRELTAKGLARAAQLLSVERSRADLLGQLAEHGSELARIQNSVRDTELEVLQGQRQALEEVATDLREATTSIFELSQQILSTEKQLARIAIRAPGAGRVFDLRVSVPGAVVPPGGTILQIVPQDAGLVFRTRIAPMAVDQVFVGQPARLRFSAFNQRTTPEIAGSVSDVSATSATDEATGQTFFWVSLSATPDEMARLDGLTLVPGMPVEAFIQTGERTVLSYLVKPIADQLMQAFREE